MSYLGATRKFSGQGTFFGIHLHHMKEKPRMVKLWSFLYEILLKLGFNFPLVAPVFI